MRLFLYLLFSAGTLKGQRLFCAPCTTAALKTGAELVPINRRPEGRLVCDRCQREGREVAPASESPVNEFANLFVEEAA